MVRQPMCWSEPCPGKYAALDTGTQALVPHNSNGHVMGSHWDGIVSKLGAIITTLLI